MKNIIKQTPHAILFTIDGVYMVTSIIGGKKFEKELTFGFGQDKETAEKTFNQFSLNETPIDGFNNLPDWDKVEILINHHGIGWNTQQVATVWFYTEKESEKTSLVLLQDWIEDNWYVGVEVSMEDGRGLRKVEVELSPKFKTLKTLNELS